MTHWYEWVFLGIIILAFGVELYERDRAAQQHKDIHL